MFAGAGWYTYGNYGNTDRHMRGTQSMGHGTHPAVLPTGRADSSMADMHLFLDDMETVQTPAGKDLYYTSRGGAGGGNSVNVHDSGCNSAPQSPVSTPQPAAMMTFPRKQATAKGGNQQGVAGGYTNVIAQVLMGNGGNRNTSLGNYRPSNANTGGNSMQSMGSYGSTGGLSALAEEFGVVEASNMSGISSVVNSASYGPNSNNNPNKGMSGQEGVNDADGGMPSIHRQSTKSNLGGAQTEHSSMASMRSPLTTSERQLLSGRVDRSYSPNVPAEQWGTAGQQHNSRSSTTTDAVQMGSTPQQMKQYTSGTDSEAVQSHRQYTQADRASSPAAQPRQYSPRTTAEQAVTSQQQQHHYSATQQMMLQHGGSQADMSTGRGSARDSPRTTADSVMSFAQHEADEQLPGVSWHAPAAAAGGGNVSSSREDDSQPHQQQRPHSQHQQQRQPQQQQSQRVSPRQSPDASLHPSNQQQQQQRSPHSSNRTSPRQQQQYNTNAAGVVGGGQGDGHAAPKASAKKNSPITPR